MTRPIAYFTWEATTDQLRWDGNAARRLGLAADQLESLTRWSDNWSPESRSLVARVIVDSSRERPDPIELSIQQRGEGGTVRTLRISGDWVDGLICGIVTEVSADEAGDSSEPAPPIVRQFTHDIAQPLAAASNYLAALEMTVGQGEANPALIQMAGAARQQLSRAGGLVKALREQLVEGEAS
jgi:hypothetical protein